jgi:ATP-dependent protease Clp, ATPase subunit
MFGWKKSSPQSKQHQHGRALRCSFCNKSQGDVAKLIAGPKVQICNECVHICVDVLADEKPGGKQRAPTAERQDHPVWCGICHRHAPLASMITVPERGYVCRECAAAVADVLGEQRPN